MTPTTTANAPPCVKLQPGKIRTTISFLTRFYEAWKRDQVSRMAAALAYYTFLALAPLLVLAVLIAGNIFGEAAARGEIVERTREAIGGRGAEAVQGILQSAVRPHEGIAALVVGLLALLLGASRAFQELQQGLGRILSGSEEYKRDRKGILRRLISLGLVLSVSLGLVMLMIGGMALDAARRYLGLTSGLLFSRSLDYLITFGFGAFFLSLLYRWLPDKHAASKDVWIGAGTSAALFVVARFLVSLYIGRTTIASSYGAAGLVVVLLLWAHLSAQIVYIGAEVARLRADSRAAKALWR
jgi:membrane protein